MRLLAGTSGYSYREWHGPFYPAKLAAARRLEYYASELPSVEINNTFYRLPNSDMLKNWAAQVPASFRFVLKASRRITHVKRLKDAEEETRYLLETSATLGERLGALLFQLPPFLRVDLGLLEGFLRILPDNGRFAFEFRHASWFDQPVFEALRTHNAALCIADTDAAPLAHITPTADWGYLRLRRADYDDRALSAWAAACRAQGWKTAFVFFKHEEEAGGPRMAARFLELAVEQQR